MGEERIEQFVPVRALGDGDAVAGQHLGERFFAPVLQEVDAGVLLERVAHGEATPGGREIDCRIAPGHLERAEHRLGHGGHEFFDHGGDAVVVGVGLVGLEHGELGVVLGGGALVAEDAAEFVDLVEAADESVA